MTTINGAVSHWFTELPRPRAALPGARDADVCIVGAGHRGLPAKKYGRESVIAWQQTLNAAVDEVIAVASHEGIDADIVKGGNLEVARNAAQARRLRAEADEDREW